MYLVMKYVVEMKYVVTLIFGALFKASKYFHIIHINVRVYVFDIIAYVLCCFYFATFSSGTSN